MPPEPDRQLEAHTEVPLAEVVTVLTLCATAAMKDLTDPVMLPVEQTFRVGTSDPPRYLQVMVLAADEAIFNREGADPHG